jgi:hypothetical protein
VLGGMWSITLTDIVQFIIKTVGIFFILLPAVLIKAGGFSGLKASLPADAFSLTHIGGATILTYFVIYFFGLVIGRGRSLLRLDPRHLAAVHGTGSAGTCEPQSGMSRDAADSHVDMGIRH